MNVIVPASLDLRGVDVTLDEHEILRNIDLSVRPGELLALLGGGGSGKSTLLRAIAGLDPIAAGEIRIDDQRVDALAARQRPVVMLLQHFPLWPHLSIARNLATALGLRQWVGRNVRKARVAEALAFIGLEDIAHCLPGQLTAAQQQRVALAQALLPVATGAARVSLLDEPFSAQDQLLRHRQWRVLRHRLLQTATTTVLATQHRDEALRFADRVAILHRGELQQAGRPSDLCDSPVNRWVAEIIGEYNLIDGEIAQLGESVSLCAADGLVIPLPDPPVRSNRQVTAIFRPRDLYILGQGHGTADDPVCLHGCVEQVEYLGDRMRYGMAWAGQTIWLDLPRRGDQPHPHIGDRLTLGLDPRRVRLVDR